MVFEMLPNVTWGLESRIRESCPDVVFLRKFSRAKILLSGGEL